MILATAFHVRIPDWRAWVLLAVLLAGSGTALEAGTFRPDTKGAVLVAQRTGNDDAAASGEGTDRTSSRSRERKGAIAAFFDKLGGDMVRFSLEHLYLTLLAILIAVGIGVPTGVYLTRTRWPRLASAALGVAGIIQTVPTLAMIAFIVLFFALAGMATIGFLPGLLALVLYALLPILRNTYTGIRQVDPAVIEVATGMGMKSHDILFKVELPLALPVIMAGVRISTVWTIGIATLCGLIGAGGLGELMFRGLRSLPRTADYLIAGTIPAALLALVSDFVLGRLERWLTPRGIEAEQAAE